MIPSTTLFSEAPYKPTTEEQQNRALDKERAESRHC